MTREEEQQILVTGLQHIKDLENFINTYTEQIEFAKQQLEITKKKREKALEYLRKRKDQPNC